MWARPVWASVVALALGLGFLTAPKAHAETRSLKLYFVHTGEKAEIAFKRDGRYLPEGLQKINHFLRDWRRNEPTRMDPRLLDLVWAVYQKTGSSNYINVVSAYRSPTTNAMLRGRSRSSGVAKKSQHMLGKAMDFYIPGVPLAKLRAIGLQMQVGGVGFYPTSGSPFVHMDVGSVRHWPRMSRRELLALFPNGRTLHVPSDGKPLPGFEQALAAYNARKGAAPDVQLASAGASGKRQRGFLASLFGGGADEEEDGGESVTVASAARPATRQAPRPTPSEALPGVAGSAAAATAPEAARPATAKEPEPVVQTIIAALPSRIEMRPVAAPRPDIGLGAPAAEAKAVEVAFNVPIPTRRPDYTPAPKVIESTVVAQASATHGASDMIATLLAREGERLKQQADDGTLKAFTGPLPSARPGDLDRAVTVAALPTARPTPQPPRAELLPERNGALRAVPAVLSDNGMNGKGARLVRASTGKPAPAASPRLALLSRGGGGDPAAAIASGVRTTEKGDRLARRQARPQPKAVVVPVEPDIARWALKNAALPQAMPKQDLTRYAYNVVSTAPRAVYTAGFQRGELADDANRFTGKAVNFLSVAKFGED